ncbi:uncharacterized protein BDZ99DRAFT_577093 [Mytilinidion resinicola]|uniref:CBM-cenC domain-containing protein n=1 Tax=Mytilinidion resinicola TaxID=574789 RepID=A0A6A6Y029_9PEZI|nr:uncharacterized protein BDZ99DRAFT_577093 [Mytilinidion resinicola]KAF2802122.1 hypothetical protein BDZ99DRAFT_577093 [Mytilinidion resinicola]
MLLSIRAAFTMSLYPFWQHHAMMWLERDYTASQKGRMKSSTRHYIGYEYSPGVCLENAAIKAPWNCNGVDTYISTEIFKTGHLDVELCAAACTAKSAYNLRHPPAKGKPKTCQFFNTYLLYKNGVNIGQYCALYTETWSKSFAKDTGHYQGRDRYTIGSSYSFSNAKDKGVPKCLSPSSSAKCSTKSSTKVPSSVKPSTKYSSTAKVSTSTRKSSTSSLRSSPLSSSLHTSKPCTTSSKSSTRSSSHASSMATSSLISTSSSAYSSLVLTPASSSSVSSSYLGSSSLSSSVQSPSSSSTPGISSTISSSSDFSQSTSSTSAGTSLSSLESSSVTNISSDTLTPTPGPSTETTLTSSPTPDSTSSSSVSDSSTSSPDASSTTSATDVTSTISSSTDTPSSSPTTVTESSPASTPQISTTSASIDTASSSTESSPTSIPEVSTTSSSTDTSSASTESPPTSTPEISTTSSSVDTSSSSTESSPISSPEITPTSSSIDVSSTSISSSESESVSLATATESLTTSISESSSPSSAVDTTTISSTTAPTATPTWILNGGFESTDNGGYPWFVPDNSTTGCTWDIVESDTDAVNGTHYARVTCTAAGQGIYILQPFNAIEVGATYVLSVWMRKLAVTADNAGLGCMLSIVGGPGLITSGNLASGAAWAKQTNTWEATSSAGTGIALYCARAANGGAPDGTPVYTYIDSIEMYRVPDRPEIVTNGDLEDSATDPYPWYVLSNSTGGTIAVQQADDTNAAYNGTNYLAVSLDQISTTIYVGLPVQITAPLRYLVTYYTRSPSYGVVNLNCRLCVSNDDYSRSTCISVNSISATATWAQKTNIRFLADTWMTQMVFVCSRGTTNPDIVGQYFIDDFTMSEYGPFS